MYGHLALIFAFAAYVVAAETDGDVGLEVFAKLYSQCSKKANPVKCLKIKALKAAGRAVESSSFGVTDLVRVVRYGNVLGRSLSGKLSFDEEALEKLNSTEIDGLLYDAAAHFCSSHRIEIDVPKLIEEGRGKKKRFGGGPFIAALAIKGFFMALAYKGIALMSAGALLVGKMALMLSALLGLKKLVAGEDEKTTFEIVKHPIYSQSHTHSTSHHHNSGGDDGHFYRAALGSEEEMMMQDKAYSRGRLH